MSDTAAAGSVAVSVVSHRHGELVTALLRDLAECPDVSRVILTVNVPEPGLAVPPLISGRVTTVRNERPHGFAANHNAAFRLCRSAFFVVLNPDIRLPRDPFPPLLNCLRDPRVAVAAPMIVNPRGAIEVTARRYPTPGSIVLKALRRDERGIAFDAQGGAVASDWVAGMFLLLRSSAFAAVGGFDEGFHLYYEDVDLCRRLRNAGHEVLLCPSASAVHDARRTSHRNLRFMGWHLRSMARYFAKHLGRSVGPR